MLSARPQLRPLGVGDILDATFALYRRNFALFAGIAALLGVPQAILSALVAALTVDSMHPGTAGSGSTGAAITGLIAFAFGIFVVGALAAAISRRYLDEPISIEGAYSAVGWSGFRRLLGATLLGVLIGIGIFTIPVILIILTAVSGIGILGVLDVAAMLAAIVLSFVVFVHLLVSPQIIVIERIPVVDAFRRSWGLVTKSFWRVFWINLLLGLMVAIVSGGVSAVAGAILATSGGDRGTAFLASLIPGLVSILVQPFQLIGLTLVYFDLRVRYEGFDLEQMVRHLDDRESP